MTVNKFRRVALILMVFLLYPFTGYAQPANLKEIRVVQGGTLKAKDGIENIGEYVYRIGINDKEDPVQEKQVPLNTKILVKSGANLLIEYNKVKYWLNYNAQARIEADRLHAEPGSEIFVVVKKKGKGPSTETLDVLEAGSEFYARVEPGGKTILYVFEGSVKLKNKNESPANAITISGEDNIPSIETTAQSLQRKQLPPEEIRRIRLWREQLTLSFGWLALARRWIKRNWWTAPAGVAAGVIVHEVFFDGDDEPIRLNVNVEF